LWVWIAINTGRPAHPHIIAITMAEREGFEPFSGLEAKSLENQDLVEG
jgi:hypothetical protein